MKHCALAVASIALVAACGRPSDGMPSPDPSQTARMIFRGAWRALGSAAAVEGFQTIRAAARVERPDLEFMTIVWSARDGRARMEQSGGSVLGSHPSGNWRLDPATGKVEPLDAQMVAVLRGHELHAIVLAPESRYHSPEFQGEVEFASARALAVSLKDDLDATVVAYFAAADTLPMGFRVTQPDPDVIVTLSDWKPFDGVRLFTRATFTQGAEEFQYEYTDIRWNDVADSVFVTPSEARH